MDEGRSELERLVATLRGRDSPIAEPLAEAVERWRRPLRIQVTGRARTGKTTVQRALALISAAETTPIDDPEHPAPTLDADLVLYVLGGTLHPADRDALAALSSNGPRASRILVVLNKADAIGTRWSDAVVAADSYCDVLALPVFPVVATLAAHTRSGILTEADLAVLRRHTDRADPAFTLVAERFTSPALAPDAADRTALLARWGLPGLACALAALRHQPDLTPRHLLQILHAASGIDPLNLELRRRCEQLAAARDAEFLDDLARLADSDDETPPGINSRALLRAARWETSDNLTPDARRTASRIHDGCVRLRERMTDAGL